MKIFEITSEIKGAKDWILAKDSKDAFEIYMSQIGGDKRNIKVNEVPKSEWDSLYVIDTDEYLFDKENSNEFIDGYKIKMTFKEWEEQQTDSGIIATTEF